MNKALFVFITLLISGCGFHLRSQNALPAELHSIRLTSCTPYGDFESNLRHALTQLGVSVSRNGNAPIAINIINASLYQDVPTIGGSNQARVYVYYYRVTFDIRDACQKIIIPAKSVVANGTLIVNAGTAIESTNQLDILLHEMQRESAHMIINILNSPQIACLLKSGEMKQ